MDIRKAHVSRKTSETDIELSGRINVLRICREF